MNFLDGEHMPPMGYLVSLLAIIFVITFTLRALPFLILQPLRESRFVTVMALWMPAGILLILALSILTSTIQGAPHMWWQAVIASLVTIISHVSFGRRTLLSIALGTGTYVALLNFF